MSRAPSYFRWPVCHSLYSFAFPLLHHHFTSKMASRMTLHLWIYSPRILILDISGYEEDYKYKSSSRALSDVSWPFDLCSLCCLSNLPAAGCQQCSLRSIADNNTSQIKILGHKNCHLFTEPHYFKVKFFFICFILSKDQTL